MKRVLIVGASSMIGSQLAIALRKRNRVWGTYHAHRPGLNGVGLFHLPLTAAGPIRDLVRTLKPQITVYCAAILDEQADRRLALMVNSEAAEIFAQEMTSLGGGLLFLSSSKVFSGAKGDYTEEDQTDATSLYGQMKLQAEHRLAQFENTFCLRLGSVFGLSQRPNAFLNRLLRDLVVGKQVPLIRDELRSFYSVDDVCGACVRVIEHDPFPDGVFHLGGVSKDSYHSFGSALVRAFGLDEGLVRAVRGAEFSPALGTAAHRGSDLSLVGDAFSGRFGYRVHAIEDSLMRLKTLLKHGKM